MAPNTQDPQRLSTDPGEPEVPPPHRPEPNIPITHPLPDEPGTPLLPEGPGEPEVAPPAPAPGTVPGPTA
jgi:hypothetical protein